MFQVLKIKKRKKEKKRGKKKRKKGKKEEKRKEKKWTASSNTEWVNILIYILIVYVDFMYKI